MILNIYRAFIDQSTMSWDFAPTKESTMSWDFLVHDVVRPDR